MTPPAPGDRYIRSDGAEVRVHVVQGGWVYYVIRRPGAGCWRALQVPLDQFEAALKAQRMRHETAGEL